jgi:hypothetical protein
MRSDTIRKARGSGEISTQFREKIGWESVKSTAFSWHYGTGLGVVTRHRIVKSKENRRSATSTISINLTGAYVSTVTTFQVQILFILIHNSLNFNIILN